MITARKTQPTFNYCPCLFNSTNTLPLKYQRRCRFGLSSIALSKHSIASSYFFRRTKAEALLNQYLKSEFYFHLHYPLNNHLLINIKRFNQLIFLIILSPLSVSQYNLPLFTSGLIHSISLCSFNCLRVLDIWF